MKTHGTKKLLDAIPFEMTVDSAEEENEHVTGDYKPFLNIVMNEELMSYPKEVITDLPGRRRR